MTKKTVSIQTVARIWLSRIATDKKHGVRSKVAREAAKVSEPIEYLYAIWSMNGDESSPSCVDDPAWLERISAAHRDEIAIKYADLVDDLPHFDLWADASYKEKAYWVCRAAASDLLEMLVRRIH